MKEFGKLSFEQFRQVVSNLPELRSQMDELPSVFRNCSREKLSKLLDSDFYWAGIYEFSFPEQIALLLYAVGRVHLVSDAVKTSDPQQAFLDAMARDGDWEGPVGPFEFQDIVGLVMVLQRNVLSIMLYHRPLSTLVSQARAGDEDALFKAIRVDRSIVACPSIAARIALAELKDDKKFFLHLRSALKGPSKKHWGAYRDLRYSLCLLRECGGGNISDAGLEDLLVHKLGLYSPAPGARKNLRKQLNESKKVQPPENAI